VTFASPRADQLRVHRDAAVARAEAERDPGQRTVAVDRRTSVPKIQAFSDGPWAQK